MGDGDGRPPGRDWLLVAAGGAALLYWALAVAGLEGGGPAWMGPNVWALEVAAFAVLAAWFAAAGAGRPAGVRAPMLAGILLAGLGQAVAAFGGPAVPPAAVGSAGLLLRELAPVLLGVAALGCYLAAFQRLPARRGPLRSAWPVAAGLVWGVDLAAGLAWLWAFEPAGGEGAVPRWQALAGTALQAVAVGLALWLLLVAVQRRPGGEARAAWTGPAGAVLALLGWSVVASYGLSGLALLAPHPLAYAIQGAPVGLGWFAGTALLAVAAAGVASPVPGAWAPAVRRRGS